LLRLIRYKIRKMKILFIGTKKYDYLQDLTYSGLTKVLGKNSVIEYTPNPRYHFPLKKYPKNLGYNGLDFQFIGNAFVRDFDCVIVSAAKPTCFQQYEQLLPKLKSSVKTVLIDGGDSPLLGGDLTRLNDSEIYQRVTKQRPFDIVFKREYLKGVVYGENVYPLPFSINTGKYSSISEQSYKYDVSFWAVESHPIRTQALDYLEGRFDCAANGTAHDLAFKNYKRKGRFYFEELKRCRISLNFRGTGWDTLRYWEVIGLKSFMISQKLNIVIPNDFSEGSEIIYCEDDLSNLEELCTYYLKNEKVRKEIAARAYSKAMTYHTDEVRAKYILEKITS